MKGQRASVIFQKNGRQMGTIVASNDRCYGIRFDNDASTGLIRIVQKSLVTLVLT